MDKDCINKIICVKENGTKRWKSEPYNCPEDSNKCVVKNGIGHCICRDYFELVDGICKRKYFEFRTACQTLHRGLHMSAHVLLNLLHQRLKSNKMRGLANSIIIVIIIVYLNGFLLKTEH